MEENPLFDKLLRPISSIALPHGLCNNLRKAGISLVLDLVEFSPEDLCLIEGVTPSLVYKINAKLDEMAIPMPFTFSRSAVCFYAENNGVLVSDLFPKGYALSNPKVLSIAKKVSVETLPLSARARRIIRRARAKTIGDLLTLKRSDLLSLKRCGSVTCSEISSVLENYLGRLIGADEANLKPRIDSQRLSDLAKEKGKLKITDLPLSHRSSNALLRGGICTLAELLSHSSSDLLRVEGLGKTSLNDIERVIDDLVGEHHVETADNQCPALPEEILRSKVTEYPFTGRALTAFSQRNIQTVEDLFKLSEADLMAVPFLGVTTVKDVLRIRNNIKNKRAFVPITNTREALSVISRVFASKEFLNSTDERTRRILAARFPAGVEKRKTLDELASELGITRERVRQLESRGIKTIQRRVGHGFLSYVQDFVTELIKSDGIKACDLNEDIFSTLEFQIFVEMARSISRSVHFDSEESIWLLEDEKDLLSKLKRHFTRASEDGEFLDESEIKKSIHAFCLKNRLADAWEEYLFNKTQKKKLGKENKLYVVGAPHRGAIIEMLVQKHFPNGISPTKKKDSEKFLAIYQESEFANTIKKPLGAMRAALSNRERFLMWGRGTYVARETVSIDKRVLKLAEEQIDKRFDADVMCVGVFGIFTEIKAEAILAGIPNPYALYSCLRLWTDGKYRFFKYPAIYPRHHKRRIIGATKYSVESYLRDKSGPLPVSAVADQLGLKEYQVINAVQESAVLLRCSNSKCIHMDNLNIGKTSEQILRTLLEDIKERLDKFGHISVRQVYDDNRVSLVKIGIPDSTCLYSFLSRKYEDTFDCPRIPYIVKHGLLEKDARITAQALVEDYFKDKTGPVYISDLVKHFSEERGYPEALFESLPFYCEGFLRYTTGAFISKAAILWNQEKQKSLKALAVAKFEQNSQRGVPYVSIDELLEMPLPAIDESNQGIYWQKKLLADILDEMDGIEILGSLESVYVCTPNKHNIESTDDLICHILKAEFSGAANRLEFQKRLLDLGIVKNISNLSEKYKIENEEISLIKC